MDQLNHKKQRQQTPLYSLFNLLHVQNNKCYYHMPFKCSNDSLPRHTYIDLHSKEQVFQWKTLTKAMYILHLQLELNRSFQNILNFWGRYKWKLSWFKISYLFSYLIVKVRHRFLQLPRHYYCCKSRAYWVVFSSLQQIEKTRSIST